MKNMFKNAGKKLTALAAIIFIILSVIAVISAIVSGIAVGNFINGFLGFIVFIFSTAFGVLGAWLSTIVLYAFGELCENVRLIREGLGYNESAPMQLSSMFEGTPLGKKNNAPQGQFGGSPYGMQGQNQFANPNPNPNPYGAPVQQPRPQPQPQQQQAYSGGSADHGATVMEDEATIYAPSEDFMPSGDPAQQGEIWTCPSCFKQNPGGTSFCLDCGFPKPVK